MQMDFAEAESARWRQRTSSLVGCLLVVGLVLPVRAQVLVEGTDDPAIRACFQQHLLNVPGPGREWLGHLTVGPEGTVTDVELEPTSEHTARLDACLVDALAQQTFPERVGQAPTTVDVPLFYRVRASTELSREASRPIEERVVATLGAHRQGTHRCFEAHQETLPPHTRMLARIEVQPDGSAEVAIVDTNVEHPALAHCLENVLRAISYPTSPDGTAYRFDYPLSVTIFSSALEQRDAERESAQATDDWDISWEREEIEVDFEWPFRRGEVSRNRPPREIQ